MLVTTLDQMARGGIHDHVGGGFHRYSTDRFWRIPHFEKMLYDNAQLASVYADAYMPSPPGDDFRRVVERLVEFVLRRDDRPGRGFLCGTRRRDRRPGRVTTTSGRPTNSETALSDDEFDLVVDVFGVGGNPNFEGRYVLYIAAPWRRSPAAAGARRQIWCARWTSSFEQLLAARNRRPRPRTDTKILTAWNGLMIRGIADAGRTLGNDGYVAAAAAGGRFRADPTPHAGRPPAADLPRGSRQA